MLQSGEEDLAQNQVILKKVEQVALNLIRPGDRTMSDTSAQIENEDMINVQRQQDTATPNFVNAQSHTSENDSFFNALQDEFEQGRFSDISVCYALKTYRLHRVLLLQSPFFRRLLTQNADMRVVMLKSENDEQLLTANGIELALRDLYDLQGKSQRSQLILPTNALQVLVAACFFELSNLATYCVDFILGCPMVSADTIVSHAVHLEKLHNSTSQSSNTATSSYGAEHQYHALLSQHIQVLEKAFLSFLCQVVAYSSFSGTKRRTPQTIPSELSESIFARLPLYWIRKLLKMNLLCVGNEFERYCLLKRIANNRSALVFQRGNESSRQRASKSVKMNDSSSGINADVDFDTDEESGEAFYDAMLPTPFAGILVSEDQQQGRESSDTGDESDSKTALEKPRVSFSFTSLLGFGGILGGKNGSSSEKDHDLQSRKRKRQSSTDSKEDSAEENEQSRSPVSQLVRKKRGATTVKRHQKGISQISSQTNKESDEAVLQTLFEEAIMYTYMSFSELEVVKNDGIVPKGLVLESYWLQTELSSRGPRTGLSTSLPNGMILPVLRFGALFTGVADTVSEWMNTVIVLDEEEQGNRNVKSSSGPAAATAVVKQVPPKVLYSEPVICAGVQYRVLLSLELEESNDDQAIHGEEDSNNLSSTTTRATEGREETETPSMSRASSELINKSIAPRPQPVMKALLQRSKRPGSSSTQTPINSISYDIYAFPRRRPSMKSQTWNRVFEPVTSCDFEGRGHAHAVPVTPVDSAVWLVAVVKFSPES